MQVVGIPKCKYIYLFFTPNYLLCKMRKNNENYIFTKFILSTIISNSYSSEICQELIIQVNNNLNNNYILNELKENRINLRDAEIDESKNLTLSKVWG